MIRRYVPNFWPILDDPWTMRWQTCQLARHQRTQEEPRTEASGIFGMSLSLFIDVIVCIFLNAFTFIPSHVCYYSYFIIPPISLATYPVLTWLLTWLLIGSSGVSIGWMASSQDRGWQRNLRQQRGRTNGLDAQAAGTRGRGDVSPSMQCIPQRVISHSSRQGKTHSHSTTPLNPSFHPSYHPSQPPLSPRSLYTLHPQAKQDRSVEDALEQQKAILEAEEYRLKAEDHAAVAKYQVRIATPLPASPSLMFKQSPIQL